MQPRKPRLNDLEPETREFYRRAMLVLQQANIPFLVGGAYSLERYTGVTRHTKDFDLFVRPDDCRRTLDTLALAGYSVELTFPHWLGKAFSNSQYVDVIFSSGNAVATVDDEWFQHAPNAEVLGMPVRLCPAEETIWSKSFVMERERYDGADIAHLLRAQADKLDWARLLRRFAGHWRVLLSQLVLFGYIYPGERCRLPDAVMRELLGRMRSEAEVPAGSDRGCQGTLLSRAQYLIDIECWGYRDARLAPEGSMSGADVELWTRAMDQNE